ncbi:periplasmic chaperone for outer membrane proteins Skp [Pseudarcicella hirudinis]|uniref:Periplasmic chaperone for outer membrane proteins Skp n=1 Tax=Pseudarcicella hirudinis TaxID=1079859 RepID=A0A1I5Z1D9_9BACT|nr:OmpH family outer membrane protein [Pseudarcicella hirudinis]SFQ50334.1 periplasmic chaperone for outer membrane proteins Skp [Pseudarcicella hirudinis]
MRNKLVIAVIALFAMATVNAQAQIKIGFINADYILGQMPEAKQVEADLKATQQQYENLLQGKMKDFQDKLAAYEKGAATMSDVIKADKEKELQNAQQSIQEFQQNSQQSLQKKQAQLLQPLLKKIEDNMHTVAKENGFTYVFNSDAGLGTSPILLHAPDDANMSDLVLKKMGITPKPATAPAPAPAATAPKK